LAFFEYFENLAEFWPNLHVISHSGIKTYKISKERWLNVVWFNDHKVAEYFSRLAWLGSRNQNLVSQAIL